MLNQLVNLGKNVADFSILQIIDEKSLIKKYQNEIRCLKEELDQLKRGIVTVPQLRDSEDDFVLLKQKVLLYSKCRIISLRLCFFLLDV